MTPERLHEIEFNFRLQITSAISAAALVTPMFTNIRTFEYLGVAGPAGMKILYVIIGSICLAAFLLRAWGAAYLSSYVVMAKDANQDKLIVAGPFMYMRNPLYTGDILGASAIGLALPPAGFFIMAVLLTLHSYLLARYEEKKMAVKFGEGYSEFLSKVNRFVPALKPYRHSGYDDFISRYSPDWPDAVMSNLYFAGLGGAFIAAAFAGYSPETIERCVYIYSFGALAVWSAFYMMYYHPKHFMGGKNREQRTENRE